VKQTRGVNLLNGSSAIENLSCIVLFSREYWNVNVVGQPGMRYAKIINVETFKVINGEKINLGLFFLQNIELTCKNTNSNLSVVGDNKKWYTAFFVLCPNSNSLNQMDATALIRCPENKYRWGDGWLIFLLWCACKLTITRLGIESLFH
jgi:hypothetical protein